jgi:pseudaminic acid synthase
MKSIRLNDKIEIHDDSPVLIVAEMSANHLGDYEKAVEIIKEAAKAGADAIKIQTYTADTMTIESEKDDFTLNSGTIWDGKTYYDLYKEAYTPWQWQPKLKEIAENHGLLFFSTPFDKTSVDFLEEMDIDIYKIASFEITDIPLIKYVAKQGKPIIFSTGIASIEDISLALKTIRDEGNNEIMILKCISSYPAPIEDYNLKTIKNISETFDVIAGLSDHSKGIVVPTLSVAFGTKIIEKHICLDRSLGGPDASFSLEPVEFKEMVDSVRAAEKAIGKVNYSLTRSQNSGVAVGRSLYVVKDIKEGEHFTEENIRSIRPHFGLHPKHYEEIIGKKAKFNLEKGDALKWDMIK